MTATQASRRAHLFLGLMLVLGLIPVAGLSIAFSAAAAAELPRMIVNACLVMMGVTWEATQDHFTLHPLTTTVALILAGSLLWAVLRTGSSLLNARRLLKRSQEYAPGLHPTLDAAVACPDFRRIRLRLLNSSRPLALTAGLWRPCVILSKRIVSGLSEEELRSVLFHELRHVWNRDPLRLLVVRFLADALWFLPVARSLARDFVDAVEESADDWAVEATRQPVELASALVKTARTGVISAVPLVSGFAGNLSVEDRVERLLGMPVQRRSSTTIGTWSASALITFFLLVLLMPPFGGREAAAERAMQEAMRRMPMMSCSVSVRQGR